MKFNDYVSVSRAPKYDTAYPLRHSIKGKIYIPVDIRGDFREVTTNE